MDWSLIDYQPQSIVDLHAMEDALFEMLCAGAISSTLMISQLRTLGISLGVNQSIADLRLDDALRDGIDVVRRQSGGRAMLLGSKYLVLSFFTNESAVNCSGTRDIYCNILKNYVLAPLEASFGVLGEIENVNDLVCAGKKFGGAAQKKMHDNVLVHCYIRLEDDNAEMVRYVTIGGIPLEPYISLIDSFATGLSRLLNRQVFANQVRSAIVENLGPEPRGIGQDETLLAELKKQQYVVNAGLVARADAAAVCRGHCDIIGGSGSAMYYKISELEQLVRQRNLHVR
ncbi:hypothetical protein HZB03_03900 [Candidatus Woesearchaeota archaeon]|nr:hypothetical protein [Candidatus Woesearchaeota archaeon]